LSRVFAALLLGAGLAAVLVPTMSCGGGTAAVGAAPQVVRQVLPGQGVSIAQVDFRLDGRSYTDTNWGRLRIEPAALAATTGEVGGYVNVISEFGRVTVNLPLAPCALPLYVHYFDLGVAVQEDVSDMALDVMWSRHPVGDAREHLHVPVTFAVGAWTSCAEGQPMQHFDHPLPEPPPVRALDDVPERGTGTWTRCHIACNVQAAHCQCFPMSVANCLRALELGGHLALPHPHVPGQDGDATLVGQLDRLCSRFVTSRQQGVGIYYRTMVGGTFDYLATHGLTGILTHRHQGLGSGYVAEHLLPPGDYSDHGITTVYDGPDPTWDWINLWHAAGAEVLVTYDYVVAVHAVRIRGVGKVEGRPWLVYTHDARQAHLDPTDTEGLEDVFVWADDFDGDGRVNLGSPDWDVLFAWAHCP
jgi:hypothetical protein